MGTKLYVGGLPYSTTEQQLSELFAPQGSVTSAKVITDKFTGQSRGFGFVEMATGEEAQKAIAVPFSAVMDFWASSLVAISTNPNPRDWPVNLSVITLADVTDPCGENSSVSCCSVVE